MRSIGYGYSLYSDYITKRQDGKDCYILDTRFGIFLKIKFRNALIDKNITTNQEVFYAHDRNMYRYE